MKILEAVDQRRGLNHPDDVIRQNLVENCRAELFTRGMREGTSRYDTEIARAYQAIDACLAACNSDGMWSGSDD